MLIVWFLPLVVVVVVAAAAATRSDSGLPDCRPRSTDHNRTVFRIALILPTLAGLRTNDWLFAQERVSPAIDIAMETVRNRTILTREVDLTINYSDDSDDIGRAMDMAINFYLKGQVDVFFGPLTDYNIAPIARQTKYWNLPLITPGAMSNDFNTTRAQWYPMLTRIGTNLGHLSEYILKILEKYKFKKAKIIYEPSGHNESMHVFCHMTATSLHDTMKRKSISHDYHKIIDLRFFEKENITKEIGLEFAVVVLCASPDSVREIMIRAAEIGFTNGEYVFINIDLFSRKELMLQPWHRNNDTAERNAVARAAYQSTLTVTLRNPENDNYNRFSDEVKRRSREQYGNHTYKDGEQVNSFVTAFHDAVILYALALNETISNREDPRNGTIVTKRMWNRSFEGIAGNVTIDENGDRNADYSLLDMNPDTGDFEIVANYYGSEKVFEFETVKKIHWPNRTEPGPPPDTPVCGFDNSKCKGGLPLWGYVIVILVVLLLFVTSLAGVFFWRERIRRKTMSEKYWRVQWSEVKSAAPTKGRRTSVVSIRGGHDDVGSDIVTLAGDIKGHSFIPTGVYRGEIVAIKKVNRSVARQTIKMNTLKEIKRLRDLQNDHLVRFIGVCIDESHESIITLYCQKGSLEDVLANDEVSLDMQFKLSLIQDIVRGMHCIHGSEIRYHGNLKTSNCVVDSRFVVKLTDFGLHFIRCQDNVDDIKAYSYWKSKLWMAPEFLRDQKINSPELRQKGDVYGFAIICQEIIYRKGPFWIDEYDELEPEIICEKVSKSDQRLPFRPTLREYVDREFFEEDLLKLIKVCWADDPMERPDFGRIKTTCNKIYKRAGGESGNIMDSLLKRMELYATNLEDLVRERTAGYLEQKKLAEDLLYAMLPKSVAEQLMAKQAVKAEEYESVTIYFSDICGFTDLSARSTPMEVVNLLNKLYLTFDDIIELVDVYKVETIGDAYMVVSGLPKRNGSLHAKEVSRMALMLLNAIRTFTIPHLPEQQLNLRIGIHSGSVCAGVVGNKMPRYCLFGDTVNTASRMESNGSPLKIHVSPETKEILDTFGTFVTELRGPVEMKGKGVIVTWWLLGELNPEFPDLAPRDMNLSQP